MNLKEISKGFLEIKKLIPKIRKLSTILTSSFKNSKLYPKQKDIRDVSRQKYVTVNTVVDNAGKTRILLSSHTKEKPREIVIEPGLDNTHNIHIRTWDGDHIPANISLEDKQLLMLSFIDLFPEGHTIAIPSSSLDYLATRGTIRGLKLLERSPMFLLGKEGPILYLDKDGKTIKTYMGHEFTKTSSTGLSVGERSGSPLSEINIVDKYRVGDIDRGIINGVADSKDYYDSGRFVGKAMREGIDKQDAETFAKWASNGIDDITFYNGFPLKDLRGKVLDASNAGAMSDIARNLDGTALLINGKPQRAVYVGTGSKYSVIHETGGHNATLNYDPLWEGWNTANGAPIEVRPTLEKIMQNADKLASLLEPLDQFKTWENTYNYYKSIGKSDELAEFLADFLHKDTHYPGGAINGYYKLGLEARARWKAGELSLKDDNITLLEATDDMFKRRWLSTVDLGWSLFTPKSMNNLYKHMFGLTVPLTLGTVYATLKKNGGKLIPKHQNKSPITYLSNKPLTFAGRVTQVLGGSKQALDKADNISAVVSLIPGIGLIPSSMDLGMNLNRTLHEPNYDNFTNTILDAASMLRMKAPKRFDLFKSKSPLVHTIHNELRKVLKTIDKYIGANNVNKFGLSASVLDAVNDSHYDLR